MITKPIVAVFAATFLLVVLSIAAVIAVMVLAAK